MVYNRESDTLVDYEFEVWYDGVTQHTHTQIIDDLLPEVEASSVHEYNGISTDWRFTYTGRGFF